MQGMHSLRDLFPLVMDVHGKLKTYSHPHVTPLFNERFVISLGWCKSCLILNDRLEITPELPPLCGPVDAVSNTRLAEVEASQAGLLELQKSLEDGEKPLPQLVGCCKTLDQLQQMTTHPDILRLLPESWLTQPHELTAASLADMWNKFDIEPDCSLALPSSEPMIDHNIAFTSDMGNFMCDKVNQNMGAPHSPLTEHDLDDLVASIPEILESPSATPPSDIGDILNDLEGMEMAPMFRAPGYSWWAPVASPVPEVSLKRDIMWGAGTCCAALLEPPIKKERNLSECSSDAVLREALRQDDISEDDDEDNLPDTPSGTDSDCDADDHMSETWSNSGSPRSTNSASWYSSSSAAFRNNTSASYVPPSVNIEHNYCGRLPEPSNHLAGVITPSDTQDEVDVVTCSDPNEAATTTTITLGSYNVSSNSSTSNLCTTAASAPSRLQVPSKHSVDVKRQLKRLAIQEAMRNRQNRVTSSTSPESEDVASTRFLSVKMKTQGKPAAYTKHMKDCHKEVIKSTKHRRRSRVKSDEGRSVLNSLKRQRRLDLRNSFEYLRQLVPETKILDKATRLQIVDKAALHCKHLQQTEQRLLKEKEKLKKQLRRRSRVESDEGRSVHDSLERQRRVNLRNSFEYLRQLVPETKILDKATKVQILKKAALHCKHLQQTEQRLLKEEEKFKKQHRRRSRVESEEDKKAVHNYLKRQRRLDLRNSFEYLRQLVPETKILDKATKLQILKEAALYCKHLQQTIQRLLKEEEELKTQLEELEQLRLQCS